MNIPTDVVLGTAAGVTVWNLMMKITWDWLKNKRNGNKSMNNVRKLRYEDTCLIIHEGLKTELKSMDTKLDILIGKNKTTH